MEQSIGLDVSLKDTFIAIREDGQRVWRGKCASDPEMLAQVIRKHAANAARVVFETGPLSTWFYHALTKAGLPAICIDARHAAAALDMARSKTDANSLPRPRPEMPMVWRIWPRPTLPRSAVKSFESMQTRTLIAGRPSTSSG